MTRHRLLRLYARVLLVATLLGALWPDRPDPSLPVQTTGNAAFANLPAKPTQPSPGPPPNLAGDALDPWVPGVLPARVVESIGAREGVVPRTLAH